MFYSAQIVISFIWISADNQVHSTECLTIWIDFDGTVDFACFLLVLILVSSKLHFNCSYYSVQKSRRKQMITKLVMLLKHFE